MFINIEDISKSREFRGSREPSMTGDHDRICIANFGDTHEEDHRD